MKFRIVTLLCIIYLNLTTFRQVSNGAIFYVAKTGTITNSGEKESPLATISSAISKTKPGDTVRVQTGVYDEQVSITKGGENGVFVNYVSDGSVVCRGFNLVNVNFVRIIGFEITHTNTTWVRGISFFKTCSHIEIIDNYIHDVNRGGILGTFDPNSSYSYITIRGNRLYWMAHPTTLGTATDGTTFALAIGNNFTTPNHWLVEYNTVARSGDFVDCYGTNVIVRNNYLHDFSDTYWTNAPNSYHSDMFQPGSDGAAVGTRNHVYERNLCGDSVEINSHFGIWQDTVGAGDMNIMIRGNVAFNFGSTAIGVISTDHVVTYNNTFYKFAQAVRGNIMQWYKKSASADIPIAGMVANTIISDFGQSTDAIYMIAGTDSIITHNLGHKAGVETSYVSTNDPGFLDPNKHNFRLRSDSPAIGAGTNLIWVTSNDGSGATFDVNDGQLLMDGWEMVDGDTITLLGRAYTIKNIVANTVTISEPTTWTNGAPVYWGTGSRTDLGAFPLESRELISASLTRSGDHYTVTVNGDARGVWFYIDGIPSFWDSSPPYSLMTKSGVVTAKAYALYAQELPVISATPSGSSAPLPPRNLQANPGP